MFGIGGSEFIIIAIIALIFLGPDKLPEATKKISRGIRELKKGTRTFQQTIENDEHIGGAIRDLKSALRGEEPAPRPRRRKVKKKVVPAAVAEAVPEPNIAGVAVSANEPAGEDAAAPRAPETDDAHDVHDGHEALPAPAAAVRLPQTAGEPDPDVHASAPGDDDAELAKLVRPASGTVAKAVEVDTKVG